MPELPEIETVRLQLMQVLPGLTVEGLGVFREKSVQGDWRLVKGRKVEEVLRKGKMLQINLSGEAAVAIHFKMTGQLVFEPINKSQINRIAGGHPTEDFAGRLPSRHTRAVFCFTDGSKMFFNDQRMFGWIKIGRRFEIEKEKFVESLGPEPFDLTSEEFIRRIERSKRPIKLVLMDQTVISGVGNIYANDALWEAEVNPRKMANSLTREQCAGLLDGLVKVLGEGIKYGGATAADAKYIDLHGMGGHYQKHFRVYDREGQSCLRGDGGIVHKFTLGGRGTYFCPLCQK